MGQVIGFPNLLKALTAGRKQKEVGNLAPSPLAGEGRDGGM
ncbi:hypothetical protein Nhal_2545 [Nitrosococcus halophilus Nc 4]|uniref:Uncharacterized protein n=1 Tax=Nitrosococcus halophilus (strain Nc4) TaxID=472759 RepID=D5BWG8_NITHN|nr:hypothetical protein Nhal_2545 [Nitrosococcus halophilus Nc 4]